MQLLAFPEWEAPGKVSRRTATRSAAYATNMATPAANIATVVIATTVHPKRELGWPVHGRYWGQLQVLGHFTATSYRAQGLLVDDP
jgi:hypothetical protein